MHTLQVTSATGGFVDYFWKAASGGCSSSGWNCIDDANAVASATFGPLTAGVEYYILLDAEDTASRTHSFQINCPVDPCPNITTLNCGVSATATLSGSGAGWSVTACGFSTPGQERVYSFTPTVSGMHTLQVTSATGGFVDYFWKAASGGCSSSGWTCIDDLSSATSTTFGPLTAGVEYYILLDAEGTASRTHSFQINCPAPAPANDACAGATNISCGSTISGSTTSATSDAVATCGTTLNTAPGTWHKFTGDGSTVTLSTCTDSTNFDTKIGVFSGTCGTLSCVAGNDDNSTCSFGSTRSTVTFATSAGIQYYVLVTGSGTSSGKYRLSMTCVCNPPTLPTVSVSPSTPQCAGTPRTLSITGGSLNSATTWEWRADSCSGSMMVGTGTSISVNPSFSRTYFVRGVGGCVTPGTCTSVTVNVIAAFTWYRDLDGDTYGNPSVTTLSCTQPTGYVSNNTDCNDSNPNIYPGAKEQCNGLDDDCDGNADEGQTSTYYQDADGDGYGDGSISVQACGPSAGYAEQPGDCDDGDPDVYPGAPEICDGVDSNCDTKVDTEFDSDGDQWPDCLDNCPSVFNPDQTDLNNNDIGDPCEGLNICAMLKSLAGPVVTGVSSASLRATLLGHIGQALNHMSVGNGSGALGQLTMFMTLVQAQSGTGIPTAIANALNAQALAIQQAISNGADCGVPTGLGGGGTRQISQNNGTADIGGTLGLFPNPNTGTFSVVLAKPASAGLRFRVLDLTGRIAHEQEAQAEQSQHTIHAGQLPTGLYLLQVLSGGQVVATAKFVKE
jgi:hypothetical protein